MVDTILIDGVNVVPLKRFSDERGQVLHMLRRDAPHFSEFGEIYFSVTNPGAVRGWIEHTVQTQNFAVMKGMIQLVLYDNRMNSKSYQKIMTLSMGEENYQLVIIPPGVVNGFKALGTVPAILANCATLPHTPGEAKKYDPFGADIPFNWSKGLPKL